MSRWQPFRTLFGLIPKDDVDHELSFHLEMRTRELVERGESPERGLDCSGLIRYVFQQVTGVTLPRTTKELSRIGKDVGTPDLEPGDLVFFNTRRFAFSHVGIYLGGNLFVHAPRPGDGVRVEDLRERYWATRYNGARRIDR